ncbi:hypothetical protein GFB56_18100 [Ensifer sp. T173]|uniref:Amidohydrolase n=1 Tax=Ensifer canadensis TaxID=555315 RepID=A0AAW4FKS3_9HYPH|nr:hypothetical protein [Ensifer canadensis]MBM3092708.1 hypothetical protein [Ensifer canadensis]UBI79672.1 hypothetical protein J3R84_32625 [Ensifer canadensis]
MTAPLDIVDIHVHLWPPAWGPGGRCAKPTGGFSPEIYRKIAENLVEPLRDALSKV